MKWSLSFLFDLVAATVAWYLTAQLTTLGCRLDPMSFEVEPAVLRPDLKDA